MTRVGDSNDKTLGQDDPNTQKHQAVENELVWVLRAAAAAQQCRKLQGDVQGAVQNCSPTPGEMGITAPAPELCVAVNER